MSAPRSETYADDLRLLVFGDAADERPGIVFFHGGGWRGGTPLQFVPQCRYLASRGMVAITAHYRLTGAMDGVEDARRALAWVRAHARDLGIDPGRIVAAGGSAGGHTAVCAAYVSPDPAWVPSACVLFNPVLDASIAESMIGPDWKLVSPLHHVTAGAPPALVLHGEADSIVPIEGSRAFRDAMTALGNRCDLAEYPGSRHGWFNYGNKDAFLATTRRVDEFLGSLGFVDCPPTLAREDVPALAAT